MHQMHYTSATELASLIRRKKVSALELLDHFLARVDKYNPKLNAIIWMDRDKARKRAKAADAALKKEYLLSPLDTGDDPVCLRCGSKMLRRRGRNSPRC